MDNEYMLEMLGIVKEYPGVKALKGIDFRVKRGTVHCVVGENGAGKSTLIKILTCAERMTRGKIILDGKVFNGKNVKEAIHAGISTVFQELNIIDQLTVADNLTLAREQHTCGVISKKATDKGYDYLAEFAPEISLNDMVSSLSFAQKQTVEIIKAISTDAKLVIMDEPTAALSRVESERLYDVVKKLKEKGVTVIYISHILDDIFSVGDYVTALRDGEIVGTRNIKNTTRNELIEMMIGKVVKHGYVANNSPKEQTLLEVKNLSTKYINDISFHLQQGEILGFYGLKGAGKSETARAIFGIDKVTGGTMIVDGVELIPRNPQKAMEAGIAMVPESRMTEGVFLKLSVSDNIAAGNYDDISKWGVYSEEKKEATCKKYVDELSIKVRGSQQLVGTLSGGNQQKVVIAKCLNAKTKMLILDEPTQGVDVGAKEEIYTIVRKLAAEGVGVLVCSSEYEEVAALCDRVMLFSTGKIIKEMQNCELESQYVHMLIMNKGEIE